ncbi:AraC family transcriptional regulator [Sorangium sp. So ce1504]|uniref:helix-turn-helix transcriptional regulator n=1 Tax=Sorangium sp. So ce1504 TaxID=3133337 RepID=UPI003F63D399
MYDAAFATAEDGEWHRHDAQPGASAEPCYSAGRASVDFRGEPGDLTRFAQRVIQSSPQIEEPSPFEHRMRWDRHGNAGSTGSIRLRSGIRLSTTRLRWEQPWGFQFRTAATPLKFNLSRGAGPRMISSDGTSEVLRGGVLHVQHTTQPTSTRYEFLDSGAECEQLALKIEPARRLLVEHMNAPPSLRQLARHVGLNEVKLKTGFRTLFGTSVFAYLRTERLERARRLLAQRHLSITEVAAQVGYANPSKCFVSRHGPLLDLDAGVVGLYFPSARVETAGEELSSGARTKLFPAAKVAVGWAF